MIPNHSPWIKELNRTRPVVPLDQPVQTEVAIVGGGIAGVTTAFFALQNTNKQVMLIEADKIAHGATGHNAGQVTSYFERPLAELVEEFGLELAIDGQRSVESAWNLMDEIINVAQLQTPLYRFTGYAGFSSAQQLLSHLKDNSCRLAGGLPVEDIIIAKEWNGLKDIPAEYNDLYSVAEQKDILALLETDNKDYIAVLSYQKGCTNSALFSEELIGYMIANYKDRFSFYEGSPVKTIRLNASGGVLEVLDYAIKAEQIVLCTNGFEHFTIINEAGPEIDTKFHATIAGRIGYMSAYIEPLNNPPTAISYFPKQKELNDPTGESYFYLTRRPHEHEGNKSYNLVCTGGPEKVLPNGADYVREDYCSEEIKTGVDNFLRDNHNNFLEDSEYFFCWHGLMGYTPNGVRRVGPEPLNPVLLYNLGCNGVGILPSIYGSKRISGFLNDEAMARSMFDPKDQRWEEV